MPVGDAYHIAPAVELYDISALTEGRTIVQFRDNELVFTDLGGRPPDDMQAQRMKDAQRLQYSGTMTRGAQKRMIRALTLVSQAVKPRWITNPVSGRLQFFKLSLITLTISAHKNIDARDAYRRLLAPFLRWLRYSKNCRHYVWKLELQQRGQVHYHIVCPVFIDYREIRAKWNELQRDNGYLRDYTRTTKKVDPNSTDVKAIGNEKQVSKYLVKYLSKGADQQLIKRVQDAKKQVSRGEIDALQLAAIIEQARADAADLPTVNGKIWDCSDGLNEKYFAVMYLDKLSRYLADYLRDNPRAAFYGEKFMMVAVDYSNPPPFLVGVMPRFLAYLEYIKAGGKKFARCLDY